MIRRLNCSLLQDQLFSPSNPVRVTLLPISNPLPPAVMLLSLASSLGCLATSTAASLVTIQSRIYDGSLTFTLENSTAVYYVPSPSNAASVGEYSLQSFASELAFTVLVLNATTINATLIETTLAEYMEDDVFTDGFLDGNLNHLAVYDLTNSPSRPSDFQPCQFNRVGFFRCNLP